MLTADEIYEQTAQLIKNNDWLPIRITCDSVETDMSEYAPDVSTYENITGGYTTVIEHNDWQLVHEFHPSEFIDSAHHVRYHLEQDVTDVLTGDSSALIVVCVEILDDDDQDNLVGWALCAKVIG